MKNDEWLTPLDILRELGKFDLDPCAPIKRPWPTAAIHYTKEDNGLLQPWQGRVWLNPPFGRIAWTWMQRMREHNYGTALLPARTETQMFFDTVWGYASAICFLKGRPHFYTVEGIRAPFNSGAPICLIAFGAMDAGILQKCGLGHTILL